MWELFVLMLSGFISLLYFVSTRKFSYWKKKNVPFLKPVPIFGNYSEYILLKKSKGIVTQNICKCFPDEPYIGVYYGTEPTLIIQDPDLLKLILVKDFYYFNGREVSAHTNKESITRSVFFESGDRWKLLRQNMTGLYSTAKLKKMFALIKKCCNDFTNLLELETQVTNVLETNTLMGRYSMDCVGSVAFGVEANMMQKDYRNNPFMKIGDLIFGKSDLRGYTLIARTIWPRLFYAFGFQTFPPEVSKSLVSMVTGVFEHREYKPSSRNDFIDIILGMSQNKYVTGDNMKSTKTGIPEQVSIEIDNDVLAGLCASFFGGAFETSATTLTLTALELAKNPGVQRELQKEIDEYLLRHENMVDYECVNEMPYLTACVEETLRLYPVFEVIPREVMEDYTFPDGLHLEKGMRVHIPLYHMQRNPKYFPNPEEYRPERFLPAERRNIKPFTYMPFGEGPRICIGMRFSKMQVNAALVTLLRDYDILLAEEQAPEVKFDPRLIVSHTIGEINLKYQPRNLS